MKRCIIPVSGGIDSSSILYHAHKNHDWDEIHTVTFNYGQRHNKEIKYANRLVENISTSHKILDMSFIKDILTSSSITNENIDVAKTSDILGDPQTVNYVPNRNMIMLSICTGYAESVKASHVYHGAAQVDSEAGYWDGTQEFVACMNMINDLNRRDRVTIEVPLIRMSKQQIIKMGFDAGLDYKKTWTCYEGRDKACGKCTACSSRIKGFIDNNMIDPIEYEIDIPWDKYNCEPI